jgi:DNA mismatch repair protein MutS
MSFQSILYSRIEPDMRTERAQAPDFFGDLNLDQIVAAAVSGKDDYDLRPFFHRKLDDVDDIVYRHEVMRDLEVPELFGHVTAFAGRVQEMRRHLQQSEKLYYRLQKNSWFVDAVAVYYEAVRQLLTDLQKTEPQSRGLRGLRDYLDLYVASDSFRELVLDTERVRTDLGSVKYCFLINGSSVTVRKYDDESDYSAEVAQTFDKFRQGAARDYRFKLAEFVEMNHIEAQVLDLVAKLHPEIFSYFDEYCTKYRNFGDPAVLRFDREVQFYVSYLEYISKLKEAGLKFSYPRVSWETKEVGGNEVFDLALATRLVAEKTVVITNDFYLLGRERVFVVSGPNQGGKTTFARTVGQLHYLACLGFPVPGTGVQLFLFDRIFVHFERGENVADLRGKLQDDLLRIRGILDEATPDSLIIMNEIFSSTTLEDAVFLATDVMRRILDLGCLCVCVTFLEELASLSDSVVSMVSTVVPEDPAQRTFKVIRRPADGRAYAISIAEKYRVTYAALKKRIAS